MPIATINPATGETVRTFDALSESDVAARLERATRAFQQWRVTPVAQRAGIVARAGETIPPRGSTTIEPGDRLFVLAPRSLRPEIDDVFSRWRRLV